MLYSRSLSVIYLNVISFIHLFVFGSAGSLLLHGPFSSARERRPSRVWEDISSCREAWAPGRVGLVHRLRSCGARAQLLLGMWGLSRPEIEPVSPTLAGRLFTTELPGKPWVSSLNMAAHTHQPQALSLSLHVLPTNPSPSVTMSLFSKSLSLFLSVNRSPVLMAEGKRPWCLPHWHLKLPLSLACITSAHSSLTKPLGHSYPR